MIVGGVYVPIKHETLCQFCANVGPPFSTLPNIDLFQPWFNVSCSLCYGCVQRTRGGGGGGMLSVRAPYSHLTIGAQGPDRGLPSHLSQLS